MFFFLKLRFVGPQKLWSGYARKAMFGFCLLTFSCNLVKEVSSVTGKSLFLLFVLISQDHSFPCFPILLIKNSKKQF